MMYGAFRQSFLDFLNRKEITPSQADFFINTAKLRLQRDENLNFALKRKTYTYPSVGGVGVALDSDFKALYGEYSVSILNAAGGRTPLAGSTFSQEQRRTRDTINFRPQSVETKSISFYLVMLGGITTLFLRPEVAASQLELVYYIWLPDYSAEGDTDILLDKGFDALLWEGLKVANMHLAEENRVKIDDLLARDALMKLQDWASRLTISGVTLDLA